MPDLREATHWAIAGKPMGLKQIDAMIEAADRIDALEAALRFIVQYERDMSPGYGLIPPWALAARNALEQK